MTGDALLLTDLEYESGPNISFGDASQGKTVGEGKLVHGNITIKEILLVKNLKYNLISISQLCDNEYSVVFDKNLCLVKDKFEKFIMQGNRCGNTYKIFWKTQPVEPVCFIAKNSSSNWL